MSPEQRPPENKWRLSSAAIWHGERITYDDAHLKKGVRRASSAALRYGEGIERASAPLAEFPISRGEAWAMKKKVCIWNMLLDLRQSNSACNYTRRGVMLGYEITATSLSRRKHQSRAWARWRLLMMQGSLTVQMPYPERNVRLLRQRKAKSCHP